MDINQYVVRGKIKETKLLGLRNVSTEDIVEIMHLAKDLKIKRKFGEQDRPLTGKSVAFITKHAFAKSRIAFQLACKELGVNPLILDLSGAEIETVMKDKDTAMSIAAYGVSAFLLDTSVPSDAFIMQEYVTLPVINANSKDSPCTAIATAMAIWETKKTFKDLKVCMIGDFNTNDSSLVIALIKLGADITIVAPNEFSPTEDFMQYCEQFGYINYTDNLIYGIKNADVVYTTVNDFGANYTVDQFSFSSAKENAMFLHQMPITRGKEVTSEVCDGKNSFIYLSSENLLHVEKAVMTLLLRKH